MISWKIINTIEIAFSENVIVDGIIILNPKHNTVTIGQLNLMAIRNIRSINMVNINRRLACS